MENNTIISFSFNGGRGHATIVLDKFFPTDATRLRKLLKMVDEDEHWDELRAIIVRHCGRRASDLLDGRKDLANKAVEYHTKATELQPEIDKLTGQIGAMQKYIKTFCSKRGGQGYQDQLKELKAKLKNKKEEQRTALSAYRDYQRQFVSAETQAKKLKKNAEVAE